MMNLDIKSFGLTATFKVFLQWVLPAFAIIAAGSYAYKIKQLHSTDNPVIYQKGIDTSLFDRPMKPEKTATGKTNKTKFNFSDLKDIFKGKAVTPELIPDIKPLKKKQASRKPKKRRKSAPAVKKRKRPVVYEKAAPPSDPRPAFPVKVNLFSLARAFNASNPIDRLNELRRKSNNLITASASGAESKQINNQPYPKEKRWSNVPQEIASFPTDMKRVVLESAFVHAILKESINSELGGIVRATVQRNVYGLAGRLVLIPSGSKVIGRYKPVAYAGQERIMIFWHRVITPDGININTVDAEMTDQMGRSGITGKVNHKYFKRYGMTFLISLLSAVASLNVDVDNEFQADVVSSFSKNMLDLTKEILRENMQNNKPTISIPAGSKIIVRITRDIYFREPKQNIVQIISAS